MTRLRALFLAACAVLPAAVSAQQLPAGLTEREVTVTGGPVPLPGTLTLPAGRGPFPAVVIVHGSGPGDRNLTTGPNAPYRDIAWGLAARGVAVYRYDKRSSVQPAWYADKVFTVKEETLEDAALALKVLRQQPEIDPRRTMMIGHSLGGMLAPRLAAGDPQLAGIILLAGAFQSSLPDQVERQVTYLESLGGETGARIAAQKPAVLALMQEIRGLTAADAGSTKLLFGAPPAYYLDLATYSSAATARGLSIPILLLQGERDYQVTPAQLEEWVKAFGQPSSRLTIHRYPKLNHLFMAGEGKPTSAEFMAPGRVDDSVIADIAAFVKKG